MSGLDIHGMKGASRISALAHRHEQTPDKAAVEARASQNTSRTQSGVSVELSSAREQTGVPVDGERLAQIRAALKDGSYPLVPTEIADAMIAAKLSMEIEG